MNNFLNGFMYKLTKRGKYESDDILPIVKQDIIRINNEINDNKKTN